MHFNISSSGPIHSRSKRGAALLSILILTTMMFIILGSFLPSTVTQLRMTNRDNHHKNAHMLAESGLEEAIWNLNTNNNDSDWNNQGWTKSQDNASWYKTLDFSNETYNLSGNYQGQVQIIADNPSTYPLGSTLKIISKGIVTRQGSTEEISSKIVNMDVRLRSPFRGIIARSLLRITGNPTFNSYNSTVAPFQFHAQDNSTASIDVGSTSFNTSSIILNNTSLNGNVVSGAFDPVSDGAVDIDNSSSVSGDYKPGFSYNFPDNVKPDTTGWATSM